jgi:competence protein ComEC
MVALAWPCGRCADLAGGLAALAADGLVSSAGLVQWAPWLTWRLPAPPLWVMGTYYLGWAGLLAARDRRLRRAALGVTMAAATLVLSAPAALGDPPRPGWLRVTFLDVGQGDATLVQLPAGRSMLVDAGGAVGGRFDVGGRVVAPALWRLGVRRLDVLAMTHADPDHAGGALSVVRDFRPRAIWDGVPVPRDELRQVLAAEASAGGIAWRQVQAGDRLRIGPVEIVAAHPPPPDWERQDVRNDDSLVLELRWGDVSIVLPGDVGREVEPAVAARLEPAALRVLKAPHHGSASSSSWTLLDALRPAAAVMSAGRGNLYGHPAAPILARYRAIGAAIFRTDEDGAITVETDGIVVRITTISGRTRQLRVQ